MTNPFFYANVIPSDVDGNVGKKAKPGKPGEFWREYHDLEQRHREFLEKCQEEIVKAKRDPGEYFAELDKLHRKR